jgi:uncharacterized protein
MTAVIEPLPRIATLDIVRGVAVMGILAMNIVAFAMPFQAYMNPAAFGTDGPADLASWLLSFIFVDGKMRGLFSFLFGASMLLVIEKAEAKGEDAARIHFRRMLWLLLFGLVHLYLIWFGDILTGYALVGMIAWFLHGLSNRAMVRLGIALLFVQLLVFAGLAFGAFGLSAAAAAPGASPETVEEWRSLEQDFGLLAERRSPRSLPSTPAAMAASLRTELRPMPGSRSRGFSCSAGRRSHTSCSEWPR